MHIKPIQNETDYKIYLREVTQLLESEPPHGTSESDRIEVLITLIEAYEAKFAPITLPPPIDAIEWALERLAWTPADLEPIIGSKERVAAILEKRQPLTLPIIHRLSETLRISIAVLAQPYPVKRAVRTPRSAPQVAHAV